MSAAALALNQAEMGMKAEEGSEAQNNVLRISSDQMYTVDDDSQKQPSNDEESAAITMAKKAAQQFAQKHPDT